MMTMMTTRTHCWQSWASVLMTAMSMIGTPHSRSQPVEASPPTHHHQCPCRKPAHPTLATLMLVPRPGAPMLPRRSQRQVPQAAVMPYLTWSVLQQPVWALVWMMMATMMVTAAVEAARMYRRALRQRCIGGI